MTTDRRQLLFFRGLTLAGFTVLGIVLLVAATSCRRAGGSLALAERLAAAGQRASAVDELLTVHPGSADEWKRFGETWAKLPGFETLAADALAPAADSGDPALVLMAVRAAEGADRHDRAEAWLKTTLERHPEAVEAAIEYAKLLGRFGRHAEAVAVLAPRAGDDPRMLNLLGYTEMLAGRLDDAHTHLARAIEIAEGVHKPFAPPLYHMGLYNLAKGDSETALGFFERAIAANPNHLEAHYGLIVAAERLGRDDAARTARAGFARLYMARLATLGVVNDLAVPDPYPVARTEDFETRPLVAGAAFERTFPAGATVDVACLAPAAGAARFTVRVAGADGAPLMDVVHAGDPRRGAWTPHRLQVPAGGAPVKLAFEVRSASRWTAWLGGAPPKGAAFAEPAALPPATTRSADPRPNVVLVSIDTLRADAVGAYGAARFATPNIDRLAGEGTRFARAEAASSWTLPSHYSLLSGLTPAAHGVMPDLGVVQGFLFPDRRIAIRGSGREVMLAEAFANAGYRTAAVTEDGWVHPKFGFGQGFGVFRAALEGSLPGTIAGTVAELESNGGSGPWFLFVHTYATHQPYHAPRALRTRWADPAHVGFAWPGARVPIEDYNRFHTTLFPPAPSDVAEFRELYAGQVLWADSLVGTIEKWLRDRGLDGQTLVAITSDHGEEIFERGQFDHGDTLFEEVTHVPLVLWAPGRVAAGRVIDGPVSLADVPATLLDYASAGDKLGTGRSLRPVIEGKETPGARLAFAEAIGHGAEPIAAAWRGRYKFVRRVTAAGTKEQLFDLAADPKELKDISASQKAVFVDLRSAYDAHRKEANEIRAALGPAEGQLDRETLERLKSLGYVK